MRLHPKPQNIWGKSPTGPEQRKETYGREASAVMEQLQQLALTTSLSHGALGHKVVANSCHAWNRKNLIHKMAVFIPRYGSAESYNSAYDFRLDRIGVQCDVS